MISLVLQQVLNGLSMGMAYVLVALGLTLVYGVLHVVNFAQGEIYMLGGLATLIAVGSFGIPYTLAIPLAVVVTATVAFAIDRFAVKPMLARRDGRYTVMLSTYAVGLLVFDGVIVSWGTAPQRVAGYAGTLSAFDMTLTVHRLVVLGVGLALLFAVWYVINRTTFGKQLRAVAENAFAASVVGIPVKRIGTATFVLAGALAGLAGALLVPLTLFTPYIGENIIIKGFVVVVVGGMGSVLGAAICGLGLGVLEAIGSIFIPPGFNLALIYTLLLVVLLARPNGLLGLRR
jgi:branched-chain amino acid transport system permease protein